MLILVVFATIMAYMNRGLNVKLDRRNYPVKGIDISHHNGQVDFRAVKADSVNFVIIKATDGVGDFDSCLVRNFKGARQNGLDIGVYHYFRFHRNGHEQAKYLLNTMEELDINPDLPIAIDIEHKDNKTEEYELVSRNVRDMVDDLHHAGFRTMIYVNLSEYSNIIKNNFDDVDLWLASSRFPADTLGCRRLWQHSHKGQVHGVDGKVDLNTFNGSIDEYHQWVSIK